MHEDRNKNIELVIQALAAITLLLVALVLWVIPAHAQTPIVRTQVQSCGFQDQGYDLVTKYIFAWDGGLSVENNHGEQFYFSRPQFQPKGDYTLELFENETHVWQHFNVLDGTLVLNVYYDFSIGPDRAKISLIGSTTDEDSEVEYEFENPKGAPMHNTTTSYTIGCITYDWSDLKGATDFYFAINKLQIWFAHQFNLDPAIVSAALNSEATANLNQRKLFYAHNRWFAYYCSGSQLVYRSSVEGDFWSEETVIATSSKGYTLALSFNDPYVHYAVIRPTIEYRRGDPNADGTITWSTATQTITGSGVAQGNIAVDINGYPYIVYANPPTSYLNITKSTFNNGTWQTASGFPYKLTESGALLTAASIAALQNGSIYVVYGTIVNSQFKGRLYNGTAWLPEETVSTYTNSQPYLHSLVAIGNNLYFAYQRYNGGTYFKTCLSGQGWSKETLIGDFVGAALTVDGNTIYAFMYSTTTGIYERKFDGSTWSTFAYQSGIPTALTSTQTSSNNQIAYLYTTASQPYFVKFHKITTWTPPLEPEPPSSTPTGDITPLTIEEVEELPEEEVVEGVPFIVRLGYFGLIAAVGIIAISGILATSRTRSTRRRQAQPRKPHSPKYQQRSFSKKRRVPPH